MFYGLMICPRGHLGGLREGISFFKIYLLYNSYIYIVHTCHILLQDLAQFFIGKYVFYFLVPIKSCSSTRVSQLKVKKKFNFTLYFRQSSINFCSCNSLEYMIQAKRPKNNITTYIYRYMYTMGSIIY